MSWHYYQSRWAFSLPFILVILQFIVTQKISLKYYIKRFWVFFIILILYGYVSFLSESSKIIPADITLLNRIYIPLYNFLWYIKSTLLPINLSPMYPRIILSTSVYYVVLSYLLLLLLIIYFYLKNRHKTIYTIIPFGLLYTVSFFPVSGILLFGVFDHADRFTYIPSVFIWLSVALFLISFLKSREYRDIYKKFLFVLLFIYACILMFLNVNYQTTFRSLYNLHKSACIYIPANYVILQKYGDMELEKKNYQNAIKIADRLSALKKAEGLYKFEKESNSALPVYLKCMSYYYLGNKAESLKIFNDSKDKVTPDGLPSISHYGRLLSIIGNIYYIIGNKAKAIECINSILQTKLLSRYEYYYYNGVKCTYETKYKTALKFFKSALELKPNDTKSAKNIARINKFLSKNN